MLAQRNPKAEIVALDIDHDAAIQAEQNFVQSPSTAK
jgi:tRNA1(Val) A37 N6-methylase TrmN6